MDRIVAADARKPGSKVVLACQGVCLHGLVAFAALVCASHVGPAYAQETWPARQVTILVPYPPGGIVDVVTRIAADGLHERAHQTWVVFNRPGGNGQVALGDLTRATPDGYTLLTNVEGGLAVQPAFDPNFHFDPTKDYTPLSQVVASDYVMSVRSGLPIHSIAELIAYAKAAPHRLTFASPGIGTMPHIGMEYFARRAGIELLHVPYPGGTGPINDLLSGQVDLYMSSVGTIAGLTATDRFRILATMNATRLPELPDVPTMGEAGLPDFVINGWLGLFGPPGMAPELRATIGKAVVDMVHDPQYADKFRKMHAEPVARGAADFASFYAAEVAKWKQFSSESDIKIGQ